jgi:hypothetical protein
MRKTEFIRALCNYRTKALQLLVPVGAVVQGDTVTRLELAEVGETQEHDDPLGGR